MEIYNYDTDGIYTHASTAPLDPLETEKAGHEVYLIPAFATTVPVPEVSENEVAVFNLAEESWSVIKNYRGQVVFNTNDKTQFTITELGDFPGGYTRDKPSEFDNWDGSAWIVDEQAKHTSLLDSAKLAIDVAAGKARSRFKSAGEGIEDEYTRSRDEAARFKAAGYPDDDIPKAVENNMHYKDVDAKTASDDILQQDEYLGQILDQIGGIRLEAKKAAKQTSEGDDPMESAQPYIDQLDAIQPPA